MRGEGLKSREILVTGGAGFIGSHLVKGLVKRGYSVRVLDNFSTGSIENIEEVKNKIDLIEGDVRDYETVKRALQGAEAVVHLAALISVSESIEKPDLYFEVNVRGTYNVSKAFEGNGGLVFISSSAVYGDPLYVPIDEDHPLNPKSPYGASKAAGESFVKAFSELNGYRPIILRLFNVYGPGQSKAYAGVITEFISRVSMGERPAIFGDGDQTRDFVHVSDVIEAIASALEREKARGTYNIGSGREVRINDLARLVLKAFGKEEMSPIHAPPRAGDIRRSTADIKKAMEDFGFQPRVELEKGIGDLVNRMEKTK